MWRLNDTTRNKPQNGRGRIMRNQQPSEAGHYQIQGCTEVDGRQECSNNEYGSFTTSFEYT